MEARRGELVWGLPASSTLLGDIHGVIADLSRTVAKFYWGEHLAGES